jgi:hypothetical protein
MIRKSESRFSEKRASGREPWDLCSNKDLDNKDLDRNADLTLLIPLQCMIPKSGTRFSEKIMHQPKI